MQLHAAAPTGHAGPNLEQSLKKTQTIDEFYATTDRAAAADHFAALAPRGAGGTPADTRYHYPRQVATGGMPVDQLLGMARNDGGVEVTLEDFMDGFNEMQPNDLEPPTQPLWQTAPPPLTSAPILPIAVAHELVPMPYSHEALSIAPQPFGAFSHAAPTSAFGGGDPSYPVAPGIGGDPPPPGVSLQAAPLPVHGHNGMPFAGWSTLGSHGSADAAAAMGMPPVSAVTLVPQWIPVASTQLPLRFCVDQIAALTGAHPGALAAAAATEPVAGPEGAPPTLDPPPPPSALEGALVEGTLANGEEMLIDVAIFDGLFDAENDDEGSSHASDVTEAATTLPRPCASCRARRVLCDRIYPCSQCARRGEVCTVPPTVRRGRPPKSGRWCKKRPLAEVETTDHRAPPSPPMSPPSSDARSNIAVAAPPLPAAVPAIAAQATYPAWRKRAALAPTPALPLHAPDADADEYPFRCWLLDKMAGVSCCAYVALLAICVNHARAKPSYDRSEGIKLFALFLCAVGLGLNYLPERTPERLWLSSRLGLVNMVFFPIMRCLAVSTMSIELLRDHAAAFNDAVGCALPWLAFQVSLAGVVVRMQYDAHKVGLPYFLASFSAYAAGSLTLFARLERDHAGSAPLPVLLVSTFGLFIGYLAYDRIERTTIRPMWRRLALNGQERPLDGRHARHAPATAHLPVSSLAMSDRGDSVENDTYSSAAAMASETHILPMVPSLPTPPTEARIDQPIRLSRPSARALLWRSAFLGLLTLLCVDRLLLLTDAGFGGLGGLGYVSFGGLGGLGYVQRPHNGTMTASAPVSVTVPTDLRGTSSIRKTPELKRPTPELKRPTPELKRPTPELKVSTPEVKAHWEIMLPTSWETPWTAVNAAEKAAAKARAGANAAAVAAAEAFSAAEAAAAEAEAMEAAAAEEEAAAMGMGATGCVWGTATARSIFLIILTNVYWLSFFLGCATACPEGATYATRLWILLIAVCVGATFGRVRFTIQAFHQLDTDTGDISVIHMKKVSLLMPTSPLLPSLSPLGDAWRIP